MIYRDHEGPPRDHEGTKITKSTKKTRIVFFTKTLVFFVIFVALRVFVVSFSITV